MALPSAVAAPRVAKPLLDDARHLDAARAAVRRPSAATPEQAQQLGRQFEQMFLTQMLAPMFEGLDTKGVFGGGSGEQMFRSFQIDAYAQAITRRGGVGIADRVAREILTLQEKQNG